MKLGQVFIDHVSQSYYCNTITEWIMQEPVLNLYAYYFKNMPAQEKLMKEVGAEYFAVSIETMKWCNYSTLIIAPVASAEETL